MTTVKVINDSLLEILVIKIQVIAIFMSEPFVTGQKMM